jgi:bacterioferritin-associated ferredoxin
MYVCICNALTDRDITAAATHISGARPSELFAACRCRAQCGSCVRRILDLIRPGDVDNANDTGSPLPQVA